MEKPNVNRVAVDEVTKDGIHMLFGIQVDHTMQQIIREMVLKELPDYWDDLPLKNGFDSVLDEGISKGTTNWQLFGSKKPGNEAYELTQHFILTYDKADGEFMMDEKKVQDFDLKNNFIKLSVQNDSNVKFEINPKIIAEFKETAEFQKAINDSISIKKSNLKKRATNQAVDFIAIVVLMKLVSFFMSIIFKSAQNLEGLLFVSVYFLYYFYMENKYQQTLGKIFTNTKVVNLKGVKPSVKQLIGRVILRIFPYVFISFFTDENGLHDSLTNTRVIDL
jgi:hypothetical protein